MDEPTAARRFRTAKFLERYGIVIVIVVAVRATTIAASQPVVFLTAYNLTNILKQHATLALVSLGMFVVIVTAGIDLALGAIEALNPAALLDSVMVVGYDANPDAVKSILAGEMTASIAQAPKKMAALGISSLVDMKAGKDVPLVTDPGTVLVTKKNSRLY